MPNPLGKTRWWRWKRQWWRKILVYSHDSDDLHWRNLEDNGWGDKITLIFLFLRWLDGVVVGFGIEIFGSVSYRQPLGMGYTVAPPLFLMISTCPPCAPSVEPTFGVPSIASDTKFSMLLSFHPLISSILPSGLWSSCPCARCSPMFPPSSSSAWSHQPGLKVHANVCASFGPLPHLNRCYNCCFCVVSSWRLSLLSPIRFPLYSMFLANCTDDAISHIFLVIRCFAPRKRGKCFSSSCKKDCCA